MSDSAALRPGVVVAATLDTKSAEVDFACRELRQLGLNVIVIDCGVLADPALVADIAATEIARAGGSDLASLRGRRDRAAAIPVMMRGLEVCLARLLAAGLVQGFFGMGGGTNAALAAAAFGVMPFGIPKLLVSTIASGDTRHVVGIKDVVLVHSVVDVLGIGAYLRDVLRRSAALMAALVSDAGRPAHATGVHCVAMTAFGSTTAAANHAFDMLTAQGLDVLTFHARGTGGKAAEAFIRDGKVQSMLDLTTTEIADELVGGVCSAGPERLDAAVDCGLPQVLLPGAIDMVNFGPRAAVPARFEGRRFLAHTPFTTLMRTTAEENVAIGAFIARKLNRATAPTAVVLPLRGFSAYDAEGAPFFDPSADDAFRQTLSATLAGHIEVIEVDAHINDRRCVEIATATLMRFLALPSNKAN